jgi:adenine phosphoribosyltransferase
VILTEGHEWKHALGADAAMVTGLGHIPQFTISDGHATPDPATMAGAA